MTASKRAEAADPSGRARPFSARRSRSEANREHGPLEPPSGHESDTRVPPVAPRRASKAVIDGVLLHWTECGTGTPLVVLHGLGDSQDTWSTVTADLARSYRVLSLDLPGCGLSGRPDASYSLNWQARLVAAWLDRLELDPVDVLGHSYGGGVALWLLLYRASSIRRLALVAPGGLGREVTLCLRLAAVFGVLEAGGQLLMGPISAALAIAYGGTLTPDARRLFYRANCHPGSGRAFTRTVRDVIGWRGQTRHVFQRVREVTELPSIGLFWGERDRVIPIRHGEELARRLENCPMWRFEGAGHFLHWQAPHALAAAVTAYLDAPLRPRSRIRSAP